VLLADCKPGKHNVESCATDDVTLHKEVNGKKKNVNCIMLISGTAVRMY